MSRVSQNWGYLWGVPIIRSISFGVYIGVPVFTGTTIWNFASTTLGVKRPFTSGDIRA